MMIRDYKRESGTQCSAPTSQTAILVRSSYMGGKPRVVSVLIPRELAASVQRLRPPTITGPVDIDDLYLCSLLHGPDEIRIDLAELGATHLLGVENRVRRSGPRWPLGPKTSKKVARIAKLGIDDKKAALWLDAAHYIMTACSFSDAERTRYLRAEANRYDKWHQHGSLKLNGMGFTEVPKTLLALGRLSRLTLERNPITELAPAVFSLEGLVELQLANTKLQALPNEIALAKDLTKLDLEDTKLRDIPDSLFELRHLKRLNIWGTPLAKDSERVNSIAKRLPRECAFVAPGQ